MLIFGFYLSIKKNSSKKESNEIKIKLLILSYITVDLTMMKNEKL